MPTLHWIGKEAVVEHHKDVPFHLLRCDPDLSVGEPGSGNLLIQGDNLLALKALLPYYAGKVKLIYIDPPYNTGNEGWVYNDNVNSPEIKEWLGKVVGREAEDLSRHDKWLCMMYPRLVLLRELLNEDGFIFISIDDNELQNLLFLLDEIFGAPNKLALFIWKSRQHIDSRSVTGISIDHEYIVAYGKRKGVRVRGRERDHSKFSNPDNDPRGNWMSRSILGLATKEQRPNLYYPITDPVTGIEYHPPENRGWRYGKETMSTKISEGRILFPKKRTGRPREKFFENDLKQKYIGFPSIIDGIYTDEGTYQIRQIFGEQVFDFSKPPNLVRELIQQTTTSSDLVLDSFAGSGTTGHAVMQLNREDGGNRRFILVEMESEIARNITAKRLKKAIEGYTWKGQRGKVNKVDGLGGGFRFCTLDAPLFDASGQIRADVTFSELARHVFFTETGEPLPATTSEFSNPLIGVSRGQAIYLLFNGILGDKSETGGNVLTRQILERLPKHDGPKVIYGEGCLLSPSTLKEMQITFRQLPYEVKID